MKRYSILLVLMLVSLVIGCGGQTPRLPQDGGPTPRTTPTPIPTPTPSVTITGAQVFTPNIGEVWTFKNGYGDITTITIEAPPTNNYLSVGSVIFHYRKNACRAYPAAGICSAEFLFALSPVADGSWRSTLTAFVFPNTPPDWAKGNHLWTSDFQQVPGLPLPYTIIPSTATTGVISSVSTEYDRWDAPGVVTYDSIIYGAAVERVFWRTDSYIESVSTPVYTGPALISDQYESICGHEKWYFAPGHGLVKVISLDKGTCTPDDPLVTMERIA